MCFDFFVHVSVCMIYYDSLFDISIVFLINHSSQTHQHMYLRVLSPSKIHLTLMLLCQYWTILWIAQNHPVFWSRCITRTLYPNWLQLAHEESRLLVVMFDSSCRVAVIRNQRWYYIRELWYYWALSCFQANLEK